MYMLSLEKAEEPEMEMPTFFGSYRKQGNSRKNIFFCFIDYAKSLCGSQQTGKFLKRWEDQTMLPVS